MTIYELAVSIPHEKRKTMAVAGILSGAIERHIYIYEMFTRAVERGAPRMDAYAEVSARCFTSEENVRKIVQRMNRKAG